MLLKHICRLLSRRWSKHRLVRECYSSEDMEVLAPLILGFNKLIYNKRWGTVMAAVHALIPLFQVLRRGWSFERFSRGSNLREDEEDESATRYGLADQGISSLYFWGSCLMMDSVATVFLYLQHFFDGCFCHDFRVTVQDIFNHSSRTAYRARLLLRKCIMSCRRTFQFASGCVTKRVRHLLDLMERTLGAELLTIGFIAAFPH